MRKESIYNKFQDRSFQLTTMPFRILLNIIEKLFLRRKYKWFPQKGKLKKYSIFLLKGNIKFNYRQVIHYPEGQNIE